MASIFMCGLSLVPMVSRADKTYAISSLSIDEMTKGSLQTFALYLKNLRETSTWEKETDRMVFEPVAVSECDIERFSIVPFHAVVGRIVRDGATFMRCGKKIGQFVVDRSGPGVKPMTDDEIYSFDIPVPSASEAFRFRSSIYQIDIASRETTTGRTSRFDFALGSIPFRTRVVDEELVSGTTTTNGRVYHLEVLDRGSWKWGRFEQKKIRSGGKAPSYSYRIIGPNESAEMTAGKYRAAYAPNVEGNTVGILNSLLQFPGDSFPIVIDLKTVTH